MVQHTECPRPGLVGGEGVSPPAVCPSVNVGSVGLDTRRAPAAPLLLQPLGVSGPLWVPRALQRRAGVGAGGGVVRDGGWAQGREQSQQGRRKRHFSLGWCSWSRPRPPESSGPAWLGCHRRPRWRWTGRHLAARPGPGRAGGAPRGLCTRLGHQDGLLPHLQDVC